MKRKRRPPLCNMREMVRRRNENKKSILLNYLKQHEGENINISQMKKKLKIHHLFDKYLSPEVVIEFANKHNIKIGLARRCPNTPRRKISNISDLELGKMSDEQLAVKVGVSKTRIQQIRKAKGIPAKRKFISDEEKIEIIKKSIENNPEIKNYQKFFSKWGFCKLYKKTITAETLKTISKKFNLSLTLTGDKNQQNKLKIQNSLFHGTQNYKLLNCRCKICKLSYQVKISFKSKFNIILNDEYCDYFANKYMKNYNEDKANKKVFYLMIKNKYNSMPLKYVISKLEELRLEILTNDKNYLYPAELEKFEEIPRFL